MHIGNEVQKDSMQIKAIPLLNSTSEKSITKVVPEPSIKLRIESVVA